MSFSLLFFQKWLLLGLRLNYIKIRRRSRAAATSKMERFVIIVNGFQPLTVITKRYILDVAAALDPPLKFIQLPCFTQKIAPVHFSVILRIIYKLPYA